MANTLYVSEFAETAIGPAGRMNVVAQMPPLVAPYTVATGAVGAVFNAKTRLVRLHAQTGAMTYTITTAGTIAIATDTRLAANQTEYVAVIPGGGYRVSALDSA